MPVRSIVGDTKVATVLVAADGSGSTTDIQEGINSLPSSGGVVYIKEGTYRIDEGIVVPSNVSLIGSGPATIVYLNDGANDHAIKCVGVSNVLISSLSVDGNGFGQTSTSHGIFFSGTTGSAVRGCRVSGCRDEGIYFDENTTACSIEGCSVTDCSIGVILFRADGNLLSGNTLSGNGTGLTVSQSNGVRIAGNFIRLNRLNGMNFSLSERCVLVGNEVLNNSQAFSGFADGIKLSDTMHSVLVGNQAVSTDGRQRYGINEETGSDYNLIVGNLAMGNSSGQIIVNGANTVSANNLEA
ncbi:MAG: hypothetical protein DRP12_00070 [Candidatus Aenigmatarchaeota archaeon]|nr:MAG: hypothetical protein DRP12_00070 [Candidatus Aenigmarchaeota archaeon]